MSPLTYLRSCARKSSIVRFFVPARAPSEISTLSLHDALPISRPFRRSGTFRLRRTIPDPLDKPSSTGKRCDHAENRSEEHTSELQSRVDLVCRLLLEKKKGRSETA